jgi:hypothetical protein
MVDENGEWFFVALSALMGAWFGGASQNNWDFNVTNWKFDKDTYWGMGIGGILGGGLGYLSELGKLPLKMSFNYRNKPLLSLANFGKGNNELALLGSTLLGGTSIGAGSIERFTTEIKIAGSAYRGTTYFEGIPISHYDYVDFDDSYYHYQLLPNGTFFKDPHTGGYNWYNIETFVGSASRDVPFYGDPINLIGYKIGPPASRFVYRRTSWAYKFTKAHYLVNKYNVDDAMRTTVNVFSPPGGIEPYSAYWNTNHKYLQVFYNLLKHMWGLK